MSWWLTFSHSTMFDDKKIKTIADLEELLPALEVFGATCTDCAAERRRWIYTQLIRFKYQTLTKRQRGFVLRFLRLGTSLQDKQIDRHIAAYKRGEKLGMPYARRTFTRDYTAADQELLAEIDNATGRLSGNLAAQFCADQFAADDLRFVRLQHVSKTTIYRFRDGKRYRACALTIEKTRPTNAPIGQRCKPQPNGMPGFLRVDTVHQGDLGKEKGVYHINLVDEIIQWEVLVAVEEIGESILEDVLEVAMTLFPFVLRNFHSDNGGEYINYTVARLLEKLRIRQTKSRARHSNDNGLAESKNGWVVRKEMGHWHIRGIYAPRINGFYRDHLISYLNFYRPCYFPERTTLKNGKVIVRYPRQNCMTPYRKLLSLPDWQQYLRPGVTADDLQRQAGAKTPLQAAQEKNIAKQKLFSIILSKYPDTAFPEKMS